MASTDLVVSRFGGDVGLKNTIAALRGVSIAVGTDDGKDILKCTKAGDWVFGQDETDLADTDLVAINPASFRHGYIAFNARGDGIAECEDEEESANIFVPLGQPLPRFDELPELVIPKRGPAPVYKLQIGFDAIIIEGKNKGAEVVYKPTSRGGLKLVRKISEEVARMLEDGDEKCVPVVELFSDSYNHRVYGRVGTPECEIVDWVALDDKDLAVSLKGPQKHPKKGEKTAKGDPVDTRPGKTSRKAKEADTEEAETSRKRRSRDDDGPAEDDQRSTRRTRGVDAPTDKVARKARRDRDEDGGADEEEAPKSRRSARDRDEDDAPVRERGKRRRDDDEADEKEAPRSTRGRSARDRDDEADDAKPAKARSRRDRDEDEDEVEDAPRRGRRDEDEDEPKAGVRGKRAAAGGRSRR